MEGELLAERFEAERPRLQTVAYRLLGSASETDDAVQEAWLRLSRADTSAIENLSGWLTTVVARICLDMLRVRRSRNEESLTVEGDVIPGSADPEVDAVLAESVGEAMSAVLQHLNPVERVAFVLHDAFGVSFEEIAGIVDRTPAAARQLASRARRRVKSADSAPVDDAAQHRDVVAAFFRASRAGDFHALLAVLAPGVTLQPDAIALQMGARNGWITSELHGPEAVAGQFSGQAQAAELALIDGRPGAVWAPGGITRVAFVFTVEETLVTRIDLVADADRIAQMQVEILT